MVVVVVCPDVATASEHDVEKRDRERLNATRPLIGPDA